MAATRLERARRAFVFTTDAVIVVMAASLVVRVILAATEGVVPVHLAPVVIVCDLAVCASFLRSVRAAIRGAPRPTVELIVAGALAVVALLLAPEHDAGVAWLIWTGMVALYLPWPAIVACGATMVLGTSIYYDLATDKVDWWVNVLFVGFQVAFGCALVRVWLFLWRVLKEAHQAQEARTMLAVSEERLRFARDLHDLLGHSLSVITVKSELAAKLVDRDPQQATAEMAEVRRLAKESLREVRTTVQGYRDLDLDQELSSARSVLEAAGVRCEVTGNARELSEHGRALLAWVVREGATNVLKHSMASRCTITIGQDSLEMRNDGVGHATSAGGSGIAGLMERLAAAGGALTVDRKPGEFVLRAEVPA